MFTISIDENMFLYNEFTREVCATSGKAIMTVLVWICIH